MIYLLQPYIAYILRWRVFSFKEDLINPVLATLVSFKPFLPKSLIAVLA